MLMSLRNTLLSVSLTALSAAASADLVFDNFTTPYANGTVSATSSTPNTFMGGAYTLEAGTKQITGFDLFPVNLTTASTTFTNLKLNIYVWGNVNMGTVNAANPAFSNLLGQYSFTAAGAFTAGFFYNFEDLDNPGVEPGLVLNTPINLTGTTVGITINVQGSTNGGASYSNVNSLTSLITHSSPPDVGSMPFNGYFRNGNGETNGNFSSGVRSLGFTDQGVAMRIYGNAAPVPEPSTMLMLGMGVMGLLAWRRRQA